MDLEAEYARCYGGAPRPEQPWHQVLALVERIGRFNVRDLLQTMEGTRLGKPPTSASEYVQHEMLRMKLRRIAYGEGA